MENISPTTPLTTNPSTIPAFQVLNCFWSKSHQGGGKVVEVKTEAARELVYLVNVINEATNGLKLVKWCLKGMGVFGHRFIAAFHEL